jgi:hypothetical protein
VARAVGRVQDLVVEDREVEGETQADGVGGGELGLGNVGGVLWDMLVSDRVCGVWELYLVSLVCGSGSTLALLSRGELGQVAVVITLPIEQNSQNRIVWGIYSMAITYILW